MFNRLLLNPTATEGGAETPPAIPTAPATVPVPLDQLNALLALAPRLAEYETREQERSAAAQREITAALLQKGQAEEAVKTVRDQSAKELDAARTQHAQLEQRAKTFARNSAAATAAAGLPFVSAAAAQQFLAILGPKLEAHPEGDGFAVRTATFQTPEQLFAEARKNPEFAHFFAASTQGGSGVSGGEPPPVNPQSPPPPKNLGDALMQQWQAKQAAAGSTGNGFGLRRVR